MFFLGYGCRPSSIGSDGQARPNNTFGLKPEKTMPQCYSVVYNTNTLYLQCDS